ncbi:MAG: DUF4926 domain-containing protein [Acidithiobacillus ferrooxidans]|uniref:DUF4926 domain-containing protein n=1 Tax=mine drainage metagenome TaxID=410659 RepID=E6QAZ7_9ZZZZ
MKVLDVVALMKEGTQNAPHCGQVGTIVDVIAPRQYLVEFASLNGEAYEFLAIPEQDLLRLHHQPALRVAWKQSLITVIASLEMFPDESRVRAGNSSGRLRVGGVQWNIR